ncbi:MAG: prepilin peptidase [Chloroflexota bacterium]
MADFSPLIVTGVGAVLCGTVATVMALWAARIQPISKPFTVLAVIVSMVVGGVAGSLLLSGHTALSARQLLSMVSVALLVALAVADALVQWVPLMLAAGAAIVGVALHAGSGAVGIRPALIGMLGAVAVLGVVRWLATRATRTTDQYPDLEAVGAGDVWISAAVGAVLGWPLMVGGLMAGGIIAAAIGIMILVRGGSKSDTLPLGACLCGGAILILLRSATLHIH